MAHDKAFRLTAKKIEKARRSAATELVPGDMSLAELPESIVQLVWLRKLDLRYNQLTEFSKLLGPLTQLQTLDLSGNKLTALPESLGQLTKLDIRKLELNYGFGLPLEILKTPPAEILNYYFSTQRTK